MHDGQRSTVIVFVGRGSRKRFRGGTCSRFTSPATPQIAQMPSRFLFFDLAIHQERYHRYLTIIMQHHCSRVTSTPIKSRPTTLRNASPEPSRRQCKPPYHNLQGKCRRGETQPCIPSLEREGTSRSEWGGLWATSPTVWVRPPSAGRCSDWFDCTHPSLFPCATFEFEFIGAVIEAITLFC